MAKITATKGSQTKQFTELQWNLMPANKYGWQAQGNEIAEAPPEVKKVAPLPEKVSIAPPPEVIKPATIEAKETPVAAPAKAKAKRKSKK